MFAGKLQTFTGGIYKISTNCHFPVPQWNMCFQATGIFCEIFAKQYRMSVRKVNIKHLLLIPYLSDCRMLYSSNVPPKTICLPGWRILHTHAKMLDLFLVGGKTSIVIPLQTNWNKNSGSGGRKTKDIICPSS